jgi:hypothetical protein
MSGNVVIRIEDVSKKFRVDHQMQPVGLRHVLQDFDWSLVLPEFSVTVPAND